MEQSAPWQPLTHDVFAGNIGETKTLAHMLERLALPGSQATKSAVILDPGFASKENLALLKECVEAHIFISVLACDLLTLIRETLRSAGELRDWKTLRRLLSTHSLVTTALPLSDGRVLRIRKASRPDPSRPATTKTSDILTSLGRVEASGKIGESDLLANLRPHGPAAAGPCPLSLRRLMRFPCASGCLRLAIQAPL